MSDKAEAVFDDLEPGLELPSHSYVIDEEMVRKYWLTQGEEPPADWRSLPVPPLLLDTFHPLKQGVRMPEGVLHARETLRFLASARIGDSVQVRLRVLDRYLRNEKRCVVFEQAASGPDGQQLAVAQKTVVWPR